MKEGEEKDSADWRMLEQANIMTIKLAKESFIVDIIALLLLLVYNIDFANYMIWKDGNQVQLLNLPVISRSSTNRKNWQLIGKV